MENILKSCKLFEGFSIEEIRNLTNCLSERIVKYNKNDIIVLSGDKLKFIGVVLKGELKITKDDVFGNTNIVSKINVSDIFAEAIVCSNIGESPINVIATANASIMYLSYDKIINICSNSCKFHSRLLSNLLKIIAKKNLFLNDKIEILSSKSIREKLNIFFTKQIERNKSTKFDIDFSRYELAEFLSVNRSALSRELSNMREEGIIKFNKNKFEIYS